MKKKIKYTIELVLDAEDSLSYYGEDLMDKLRERGEAEVINIEIVEENEKA